MAQIDQIQTDIDRLLIDVDRLKNSNANPESVIKEYIPDISDLNVLNNDLDTLNNSLDDLAMDLYGDESHEGLVDYLNTLQVQLYGKGQTYTKDGVVHNCTITDPCPDSLKGRLNTLRTNLDDLSLANADLKKSLKALTDSLTNFSGTFAQFKQSLEAQGIHYDSLDASIQSLLHSVYNTFQAIDVVDGRVDDVNDTLGDPADTTNTSVFGKINNTNVAVDNVSNQADKVEGRMYAGWDESTGTKGSGTITQPATGTVKKNLDVVQTDIVEVRGVANDADEKADVLRADVGIVKPDNDGSLQEQITYLPAYISELIVTANSSTYKMGSPITSTQIHGSNWYIAIKLSELAKKTIRDNGSITFDIIVASSTTNDSISRTVNTPTDIIKIPYNFIDLSGVVGVICENLKHYIYFDNYALRGHTHSKSEITDFSHTHQSSEIIDDSATPQWEYVNSRAVSDNQQIHIYRLGDIIIFEGSAITTAQIPSGGELNIGHISPIPSHKVYCSCSGLFQGYIIIQTDGIVALKNLGSTMSSGHQFAFNCTYPVLSNTKYKLTNMGSSSSITQTNNNVTLSVKLSDNNNAPVQGETVFFYYDDGA